MIFIIAGYKKLILILALAAIGGCTPSPEFVKHEADKVKIALSPPSAKQTQEKSYTLQMVIEGDSMPMGAGIPIRSSGTSNLGATFQINKPNIASESANTDAEECVSKSVGYGVIQKMTIDASESTLTSQSIEPFLARFKLCLQAKGYSIDE